MRGRARVGYDSLSINVLELFGMVWTVYMMIVIRMTRGGGGVDKFWAIQSALNCKGGEDDVRSGGLMRILGVLEVKGK